LGTNHKDSASPAHYHFPQESAEINCAGLLCASDDFESELLEKKRLVKGGSFPDFIRTRL
jgi:hypothetical protein